MFKVTRVILMVFLFVGLERSSFAGFINGGFELGNTSGWAGTGTLGVVTPGLDIRTNNLLSTVANGAYAAKVGDQVSWQVAGPETSGLTQTETVAAGDDADLYFNYAVVALVPTNGGHTLADTPFFQVDVSYTHNGVNSALYHLFEYSGNPGTIQPGWLQGVDDPSGLYGASGNSPGTWYYFPWTQVHVNLAGSGIQIGDTLTVALTTRDCDLGGHAAYAYLDGFGSTPAPIGTPEPGSFLLLGLGSMVLFLARKQH